MLVLGETVHHYRILDRLGAGGMGEVYRARDERLGRDVALKVLPDELSADFEQLRRLRAEARSMAAVDHPNVATIHAVEEHEGRLLLVTTSSRTAGSWCNCPLPCARSASF